MSTVDPIRWQDGALQLLDQRLLPHTTTYVRCGSADAVADAIAAMVVRGAPAIGISAAYGMALAAREARLPGTSDAAEWHAALRAPRARLAASRPTAVNLFWALARVDEAVDQVCDQKGDIAAALEALAIQLHREDIAINQRLGDIGARLIEPGSTVYTHCNAGALATGGYGTALGVIRSAWRDGSLRGVYAGETRPWLQGARLTAWELMQEQIPVTLCTEGAAGSVLRDHDVRWVIVGADRVAANGDVANKIGTYNLAVLARHHGLRFMAAVPTSSFDLGIASGAEIPIEQRGAEEITHSQGQAVAPDQCAVTNPAFDVTPAALVDVIVTEYGVIENPTTAAIREHFQRHVH
ncbi:MAG TPA: S-methyl-5-thioribose-1-phosphate isomerase [Spongiibacteraceae bacterium]|nr:S-methyl-5-thioribose-1-phosphate isomerase [Spongiibacteraceae bacterium]HUH37479.1 S-methyl-5-thioribose-1-phosphate isomerase [Spongiibacteraceae bacterium]